MIYPAIYEKQGLTGEELARTRAMYILAGVARRQNIPGHVSLLSRSLGFADSALQVAVSRLRMSPRMWQKLRPHLLPDEITALKKELELPDE